MAARKRALEKTAHGKKSGRGKHFRALANGLYELRLGTRVALDVLVTLPLVRTIALVALTVFTHLMRMGATIFTALRQCPRSSGIRAILIWISCVRTLSREAINCLRLSGFLVFSRNRRFRFSGGLCFYRAGRCGIFCRTATSFLWSFYSRASSSGSAFSIGSRCSFFCLLVLGRAAAAFFG